MEETKDQHDLRQLAVLQAFVEKVEVLVKKADSYVNSVVPDYVDSSTCTEDPCPFCTASVELQIAIQDVRDDLYG